MSEKVDLPYGAHGDTADTLWLRIFSLRHKDSIAGHGVYILSVSFWNLFLLVAIQIDKDDSRSYCKAVRGLLFRRQSSISPVD